MNADNLNMAQPEAERLKRARTFTERVERYLHQQIKSYLGVLRPALAPHRVLGKYIEHPANQYVSGSEKTWARLLESYRRIAAGIPSLPRELPSPLAPLNPAVETLPWEYTHHVQGQDIAVACPCKWVLLYPCGETPSGLSAAVTARSLSKPCVQLIIGTLILNEVVCYVSELQPFLAALRLDIHTERLAEVPDLPFTTLTFFLKSRLPSDEVVLTSTRLTGVPRFTELIEPEAVNELHDPIRSELERIAKQA